jgi:hypothetical protein
MYNYCNICNISICFSNIRMKQLQHITETSETFEMYTCNKRFERNISLLLGRNEGSLAFEVHRYRARRWRRATSQGDAMLSSASQPRSVPRHRRHESLIWIHAGEGARCRHHRWEKGGGLLPPPPLWRKKGNRRRIHRRGGSAVGGKGEGVLPSGEEWPPRPPSGWGKAPRPSLGWVGHRGYRGDGEWHIGSAARGCNPSASVACGGENLILPSSYCRQEDKVRDAVGSLG